PIAPPATPEPTQPTWSTWKKFSQQFLSTNLPSVIPSKAQFPLPSEESERAIAQLSATRASLSQIKGYLLRSETSCFPQPSVTARIGWGSLPSLLRSDRCCWKRWSHRTQAPACVAPRSTNQLRLQDR